MPALGCLQEVHQLVVDVHLLQAPVEAGGVAEVPQFQGLLAGLLGDTGEVHRLVHLQELIVALVDDGPRQAAVHPQGEVLLDGEELDPVVLAVRQDLVAEHGAHRVVPNVVGDSDPPSEELHRQMLVVPDVQQHTILLLRGKRDRHIGLGFHIERLQLYVGDIVEEAETGEVLAALAAVPRGALADVVGAAWDVHADAVLAVVLLARRGLWVEVGHHRLDLAELAGEVCRALARVLVGAVSARAAVLAHVVGTVVNVGRAVLANEAWRAVTCEVSEVVLACATILTRVWFHSCTEGDLLFTIPPLKPRLAATLVLPNFVDACSVVLAPVVEAIVDIFLATDTREAGWTLAAEKKFMRMRRRKRWRRRSEEE